MNLDNSIIPKEIQQMIVYFGVKKYTDFDFIIGINDIIAGYIYNRALDNYTVLSYIRGHRYFESNSNNSDILDEIERNFGIFQFSIAEDTCNQRIKLYVSVNGKSEKIIEDFLESIGMKIQKNTISHSYWMIGIDFSFRDPGWKIYWKVDSNKFLKLIPDSHTKYIEHVLMKQDISRILPGRNNKIYFKYSGLPQDSFFQNRFPICRKTGILKPNYYAIQPENHEESLYYFIDPK